MKKHPTHPTPSWHLLIISPLLNSPYPLSSSCPAGSTCLPFPLRSVGFTTRYAFRSLINWVSVRRRNLFVNNGILTWLRYVDTYFSSPMCMQIGIRNSLETILTGGWPAEILTRGGKISVVTEIKSNWQWTWNCGR